MMPASFPLSDIVALVSLLATCAMFILYRRRADSARAAEHLSLTDPLTGLHNRRFLEQVIGMDVATSLRHHRDAALLGIPAVDADLVFLMLDIDHFKSINDRFGHAAGDHVLVCVADLLRRIGRDSDAVLRWGGEEFLIVARFTDRRLAAATAERIRRAIEVNPLRLPDGGEVSLTCSIGFAAFPFEPAHCEVLSWQHVLTLADFAVYDAKRLGRNCWIGYGSTGWLPPTEDLVSVQRTAALVDGGLLARFTSAARTLDDMWRETPALALLKDGSSSPSAASRGRWTIRERWRRSSSRASP